MLRLKKVEFVARNVALRLPTENPNSFIEGTLVAKVRLLPKETLKAYAEESLTDAEYCERILIGVEGLADENDQPLTGDAALNEVYKGVWSAFLQNAILQDYWEQYGEARAKNSKPSRGR